MLIDEQFAGLDFSFAEEFLQQCPIDELLDVPLANGGPELLWDAAGEVQKFEIAAGDFLPVDCREEGVVLAAAFCRECEQQQNRKSSEASVDHD